MESAYFMARSSSPASSVHSVQVLQSAKPAVASEDQLLDRQACSGLCVVDRCSAHRRETFFYHLGKKSGWCS